MSKTKSSEIPHYELLYIISNKFSEDELKPVTDKVEAVIKNNKGEIKYQENWGKKHLAYPINGFSYGYYQLIQFDLAAKDLAKVERTFRMMSEVLRHQIVRNDGKIQPKPAKPAAPAIKEEEAAPAPAVEEKAEKTKAKTAKNKTDLKDLDEKLDKILETSDLL